MEYLTVFCIILFIGNIICFYIIFKFNKAYNNMSDNFDSLHNSFNDMVKICDERKTMIKDLQSLCEKLNNNFEQALNVCNESIQLAQNIRK